MFPIVFHPPGAVVRLSINREDKRANILVQIGMNSIQSKR